MLFKKSLKSKQYHIKSVTNEAYRKLIVYESSLYCVLLHSVTKRRSGKQFFLQHIVSYFGGQTGSTISFYYLRFRINFY